jgi:4-amino-4-deoxy-L-arabinose transferase-like glycosyltransferase
MWRDALKSRKTHVLLALALCWLAWQIWLTLAASAKLTGLPSGVERLNIRVTLAFPPERFHVQLLQTFGRVSGSEQNTVELRGVKRADLASIARPYWVKRIEPLQSGG